MIFSNKSEATTGGRQSGFPVPAPGLSSRPPPTANRHHTDYIRRLWLLSPGQWPLGRSFYFRQTHAIDITEKISAGRSLLLATAWSDRQRAGGRLGPGSASAWRPA